MNKLYSSSTNKLYLISSPKVLVLEVSFQIPQGLHGLVAAAPRRNQPLLFPYDLSSAIQILEIMVVLLDPSNGITIYHVDGIT